MTHCQEQPPALPIETELRLTTTTDRLALASRISEFIIADRVAYGGKTSLPYAEKYVVDLVPPELEPWMYDHFGNFRVQVGRVLYVAEEVRKADGGYRQFRFHVGNFGDAGRSVMKSEIGAWTQDLRSLLNVENAPKACVKVAKYLWMLAANPKGGD